MKLTTSKPFSLKGYKGRLADQTISVSFVHDNGFGLTWDVEAEVEVFGEGENAHFEMVHCSGPGVDEVSDETHRRIKEKAEELAWLKDQKEPKNTRYGCNCVITGDGELKRALHDEFCPLRLSAAERDIMRDQERKEARSASRSSYDEARELERAEMTEAYLNLK